MNRIILSFLFLAMVACENNSNGKTASSADHTFDWHSSTIYFLLTDRFHNAESTNDFIHPQDSPPDNYRGFMGGDIKGITEKIKSGYFSDLGVDAIWFTPVVEQISGSVDEGTGTSYGYHGYWTRDWTDIDPRFGTKEDLSEMVKVAHAHNLRVIIDVVANHTGPVTEEDGAWPDSWIKTGPTCVYQDYETTTNCTLVENLPDIKTESNEEVSLPKFLVEKWQKEGRYEKETQELETWFAETGYRRTAVNYILKWLVDFIVEYGVDGFRVDTVKHTEAYVWKNLYQAAVRAWENYKNDNPKAIIDKDTPFYMVGEVYNYYISGGRGFDYGDTIVDFYDAGFDALINFDFKTDANNDYESIFSKYDSLLAGPLLGKSVLNYISSHDDSSPFDRERSKAMESGTKLLLTQGGSQIYYGDESARNLSVDANGDASLRSFMNWEAIETGITSNTTKTGKILNHWRKLGKFRQNHPSIGAGRHQMITASPYVFKRTYSSRDFSDAVVIGLDFPPGTKTIPTSSVFSNGTKVRDAYSGQEALVDNGKVILNSTESIVLLEKI
jgi:alpha-amylase